MENNIQENVLYDKHGKIHMLKDYDKDDNTAVNRLLEAESKDNDKNLRSYVLSKQSIYKNLAVLSISFLLLFSAFLSLQNLQSSLNIAEGLGTIGLSCVYGSLFVSSLFLPAFMLSKLGMKWTMVLSIITYLGYIAASFHAVWETIVPTSILLGLGGANLWSAKMAYISELAKHYSSVTSMASSVATDKLFGVFFAIYHTGDIWGNLASSLVFSRRSTENITETNSTCGVFFCPLEEANNPNLIVTDQTKIYIYSGFCLGCGVLAALLMAIFLDNLKPQPEKEVSTSKLLTSIFRHFLYSRYQQLLIPVTVYRGFSGAFIIGDFNAAFTSCTLGVEYVGFIMICYGVSSSVSAFVFTRITRWTGYSVLFITAFVLHAAVGTTLFIWTPNEEEAYVFYILVALWVTGYSVYSAILSALYGNIFLKNSNAAFSCFRVLDSLGWGISFSLSSFLCTYHKLIIDLVLLLLSTILVLIVVIHSNRTKK